MTELKNTQLMVDVAAFHAIREQMMAYQQQVSQCCKRLDELALPLVTQLSAMNNPPDLVYLNGHPYHLELLDDAETPVFAAIHLERMRLLAAEPYHLSETVQPEAVSDGCDDNTDLVIPPDDLVIPPN
jgi:hypothetical protein